MNEETNITIKQEQRNGVIYLCVEFKCPIETGAEYAFYFFRNNEKINVQWYTTSPNCEFRIDSEGIYHVAAFVRRNTTTPPEIYTSHPYQVLLGQKNIKMPQEVTLSIFGSCVSRDLLECKNAANIHLKHYIARHSIVSAVSAPIPVNEYNINLTSSFQKKQVMNDFSKLSFDLLRDEKAQFLLIDLVDERFRLAKYNGSYVTYSQECKNSGLLPENTPLIDKEKCCLRNGIITYRVEDNNLDDFMDLFCKHLIMLYPPNRIILHRVYGAEHYIDANGEIHLFDQNTAARVKRTNIMYEYMYDYIYTRLNKEAGNIDISRSYYACLEHKWGLAPIHFQQEYYIDAIDKINTYIRNQIEEINS